SVVVGEVLLVVVVASVVDGAGAVLVVGEVVEVVAPASAAGVSWAQAARISASASTRDGTRVLITGRVYGRVCSSYYTYSTG
ncbi:MAG: hypothetical protein OEM81_15885, partial [Acidimicrobiia bacterium]|nr:hypothetical protein [Acidimicrobiia bacterium]